MIELQAHTVPTPVPSPVSTPPTTFPDFFLLISLILNKYFFFFKATVVYNIVTGRVLCITLDQLSAFPLQPVSTFFYCCYIVSSPSSHHPYLLSPTVVNFLLKSNFLGWKRWRSNKRSLTFCNTNKFLF